MSVHQAFRRQPVPGQFAQQLRTITIPAPTRGIIMHENEAFMGPGSCIVSDNWLPTMRGVKLRGGCIRYCVLPETTMVVSAFEYTHGTSNQRMFAGNATKLYDVSSTTPVLVQAGQLSGNYAAAQITSAAGVDTLTAVNDAGDFPLQFNGSAWTVLNASQINASGPGSTNVAAGKNLTYVWKYRSRLFFVEADSMNAWYLGIDSIAGTLQKIPLAGNATKGGKLLFGASWSVDAGDGIDDKCVFVTDLGEVLIFTGNNPADPANWRQEGRYALSPPLGMNGHISVGGDLIILTVDGMVPLSLAITKDAGQLELAMLTRAIKPLWRDNVDEKRAFAWSAKKWDEFGGIFIAIPGGQVGQRYCLAANNATGAWGRCMGWDATCFIRQRADCFFGTQDGVIMQMDRTGFDDGQPYLATLVGGWEMFQAPSQQVVWHQARAIFNASVREPFQPQISACTDFILTLPPAPPIGLDIPLADVWDQGQWGPPGSGSLIPPPPADVTAYAQWDQPGPAKPVNRNTMWVSIGLTGFSHAPIVQIYVGQQVAPKVELVAIAATYEIAGVNVD